MLRRIPLLLAFLLLPAVCFAKNDIPADYFFAVDHKLPLEAHVKLIGETADAFEYQVDFLSMNRQRVPALLFIPKNVKPPYPVVMVQHGFGDSKNVDYVLAAINAMVKNGAAAFAIDAQYHGERKSPFFNLSNPESLTPQLLQERMISLRDMFIQTVMDLQRGLDYLDSRPDIDPSRTAYIGMSMGAIMGATFTSLDRRVECAALLVGGGDFMTAFPIAKAIPGAAMVLRVIDPIYYIGGISPRPLLMINATKDEIIPKTSTDALFNAAGEPKKQIWIDSQHYMPVDVVLPIVQVWIQQNLPKAKSTN